MYTTLMLLSFLLPNSLAAQTANCSCDTACACCKCCDTGSCTCADACNCACCK